MAWIAFRLVYQAKSPVHIGWHSLGYVLLTRYYILGRNIWGAFTANLTRAFGRPGIADYGNFQTMLKKEVLSSYFYPALDPESPLLPKYTADGLKYGTRPEHEFQRLLIKSFGQTAILPESNTAQDESLHESEFIVPRVEDPPGFQQSVFFVGYLFIQENILSGAKVKLSWTNEKINIQDAVSEIFVGADKKYGWGRLVLKEWSKIKEKDKFFESPLILKGDKPEIVLNEGAGIPAHLPTENNHELLGDIEPLLGREWGTLYDEEDQTFKIGSGRKIAEIGEKGLFHWVPGSTLRKRKKFSIGPYGILR